MAKGAREFKNTTNSRSSLPNAAHRFLSQAVVHALETGWRSADDFLRFFGPDEIMRRLEQAPDLRTEVLVKAAGVNEKIARKKSTASASEDLRLALAEGITDPASVLALFPPDDRVRHLDVRQLWGFLAEGEFWTSTPKRGAQEHSRACKRMTFLIEVALAEQLITLRDLADGISFQEIAARLPVPKLQRLVQHALECSRLDVALSEEVLLEIVPLAELIEYVPLETVWQNVVLGRVARPANFLDGAGANGAGAVSSETTLTNEPAAAPASAAPSKKPPPKSAPPPLPTASGARAALPSTEELDLEFEALPAEARAAAVDPVEAEARAEVTERLRQIDRLPPSHATLPVPVLLSIDGMYADLFAAADDAERADAIRDSFPNEGQLRTALIALIELLDPTINTQEPLIRDAELDALINIVLFEERRRGESRPVPSPTARNTSRPPPLPSTPPPLPGTPPPLPKQLR